MKIKYLIILLCLITGIVQTRAQSTGGESQLRIGANAFKGAKISEGVVMPDNLVSIGAGAFRNIEVPCLNFRASINLEQIRENAFNNAQLSSYNALDFSNSHKLQCISTSNSNGSFVGFSGEIILPRELTNKFQRNALTTIGANAFKGMKLTENKTIDLSDSHQLLSIGNGAFQNSNLSVIILPDSLTKIGNNALNGCTDLSQITSFNPVPPSLGTTVFSGVNTQTCKLRVPDEGLDAYQAADQWKDFFNSGIIGSVSGVTLSETQLSLTLGETTVITAMVEPNDAVNKNITWSSSNPAVATVNNRGTITAVAAGTAIIRVTTAEGNKTATCIVIVKPQAVELNISADRNYIHTITYTEETSDIDPTKGLSQIQYFDGLGRPVQTVQHGITPNAGDLVTYQEYDLFGRDGRSWLPAVAAGNGGAYMTLDSYKAKAMVTYDNDSAYSRPVYEASPLNRVLEQYGPGKEWYSDKKAVRTGYLTNQTKSGTAWADSDSLVCAQYMTTDNARTVSLSRTGNYKANELYVTRLKDEDGNTSYEFKDKLGQVVLTRQINDGKLYDTNYIYDSFGNLRAVLPPEASDKLLSSSNWTEADTHLNQYAYLYKYDSRNRCIAKKIPGCDWIYYVYDKADRLIYTQDGEQRLEEKNEWTFSIPDAFGRTVLSGISKDTISVSNKLVKATYSNSGNYKRYTIEVDNTARQFASSPSILSVNYYDNYDFRGMDDIPSAGTEYTTEQGYGACYGDHQSENKYKNKGLLTGTLTAQMEADGTISSNYLYSVMYYDNRGRLIQIKSNNHLAGGTEKEYIAYNFTGQPVKKMHIHQATGKNTLKEEYTYSYDHAGRLLSTTHQLNGGTVVPLTENTYDNLGRLATNGKGGQANLSTNYNYNIRSWTNNIANTHFSETLAYAYNGNISRMQWTTNEQTRSYDFAYDNLSRLKTAVYAGIGNEQYGTSYTYDKHGNMLTLQRYGKINAAAYGLVDDLRMQYNGNQLKYVADDAPNILIGESADFKDKPNPAGTIEYTYNANGAMKSDLNKGITEIRYNSLNLPQAIEIANEDIQGHIKYTYSASGAKLRTIHETDMSGQNAAIMAVAPFSTAISDTKTTDYAGNIIYETNSNQVSTTSKIRILIDGGYIEDGTYHYYISDHLGNNRVVVDASGSIIQKNHYYPFGTAFAENSTAEQGKQPYKYNGKELDMMHGLNWYDSNARFYDPAIPRTPMPDPHAENYYAWSPYSWVGNNPISVIDPTGMDTTHMANYQLPQYNNVANLAPNNSSLYYKVQHVSPGGENIIVVDNDLPEVVVTPSGSPIENHGGVLRRNGQIMGEVPLVRVYPEAEILMAGRGIATATGKRMVTEAVGKTASHNVTPKKLQQPLPIEVFSSKAPMQTTPGTKQLSGVYINDLGKAQPWKAAYDKYGRLVERTDFNARNIKHGIPEIHYHTIEYLPKGQLLKQNHIEGIGPRTNW